MNSQITHLKMQPFKAQPKGSSFSMIIKPSASTHSLAAMFNSCWGFNWSYGSWTCKDHTDCRLCVRSFTRAWESLHKHRHTTVTKLCRKVKTHSLHVTTDTGESIHLFICCQEPSRNPWLDEEAVFLQELLVCSPAWDNVRAENSDSPCV